MAEPERRPIWEQPDYDAETFLYQYRAELVRVVDGDTIRALVDQGLGSWRLGRIKNRRAFGVYIRFARIDAWETRGRERPQGLEAKAFVSDRIAKSKDLRLFTYRDTTGVYGRLIADIALTDESGDRYCLNDALVSAGMARYQAY